MAKPKKQNPSTRQSTGVSGMADLINPNSYRVASFSSNHLAALQGCSTSISTVEVPTYEFYH